MDKKRASYLSWDDYFMGLAFLAAKRSKDPSSQVGAAIVDEDNKIVGVGYNGMPIGCEDDQMPWARRAENVLDTKYPYVCHAEMNAILNKNSANIKNCRIYVALFPCNECAKLIIQSGIRQVIYLSDKYHRELPFVASRRLLTIAGVQLTQYQPRIRRITIDFDEILGVAEGVPRPDSNNAAASSGGAQAIAAAANAAAANTNGTGAVNGAVSATPTDSESTNGSNHNNNNSNNISNSTSTTESYNAATTTTRDVAVGVLDPSSSSSSAKPAAVDGDSTTPPPLSTSSDAPPSVQMMQAQMAHTPAAQEDGCVVM